MSQSAQKTYKADWTHHLKQPPCFPRVSQDLGYVTPCHITLCASIRCPNPPVPPRDLEDPDNAKLWCRTPTICTGPRSRHWCHGFVSSNNRTGPTAQLQHFGTSVPHPKTSVWAKRAMLITRCQCVSFQPCLFQKLPNLWRARPKLEPLPRHSLQSPLYLNFLNLRNRLSWGMEQARPKKTCSSCIRGSSTSIQFHPAPINFGPGPTQTSKKQETKDQTDRGVRYNLVVLPAPPEAQAGRPGFNSRRRPKGKCY